MNEKGISLGVQVALTSKFIKPVTERLLSKKLSKIAKKLPPTTFVTIPGPAIPSEYSKEGVISGVPLTDKVVKSPTKLSADLTSPLPKKMDFIRDPFSQFGRYFLSLPKRQFTAKKSKDDARKLGSSRISYILIPEFIGVKNKSEIFSRDPSRRIYNFRGLKKQSGPRSL